MQDWETGKVILSKVVRRKAFVLGKSTHLREHHIVVMDNGEVRSITFRNPELYDRAVTSNRIWGRFESAIELVRVMEAKFITEELPEVAT
ncbi:hypothetical protein AB0E08_03690 [Streptomyces sp. NPDC048281]|uniref:hypothetical protein n=1 Tax=Streptomyces sp. NPDC048281 TaxID=3154715 RepID=UPI003434FE6A